MAPVFLLPPTVVHANGTSPAVDLPPDWHTVQLTLGITTVVEQESLELLLEGSPDGTTWLSPPLASFPQKFYVGTSALVLILPPEDAVRFLRVRWVVNRWGRGSLEPRFGLYVVLDPGAS
jgi:hypothetical protein